MLNVLFFNARTFLNKEVQSALRRRSDIHTLSAEVPVYPPPDAAQSVFDQLAPFLPAVVVSLNDAGYDSAGVLSSLLAQSGSFQINWYYDDPLYEHIYYKRALPDLRRRIDFVSEQSFAPLLRDKGFNAHFLPLAAAPEYFNMNGPAPAHKYDISFVGSSSLQFMDGITTEPVQNELDKFKPLLARLRDSYNRNPRQSIRDWLYKHDSEWRSRVAIDPDAFVFVMQWMVGYLYRKDFVVDIARTYKQRFICLGDIYWSRFMDPALVSTDALYYTNLCSYYRSCKINLNINRIQTLTSFTQRIFDCKASGAFLLTDRRALNSEYFVTEGENREFVEYTSLSHCKELIDHYLIHDDERERIALAGRENVLKNHTYDNRIEEILALAKKTWGI
jgi:spore maturation protein CgeB